MDQYSQLNSGPYGKEHGQSNEASKKRRSARKKSESKIAKGITETSEAVITPDYAQELNSDLAQYTYKLEFELLHTRKKLKLQRKNFQSLLKSLTLYFDHNGITPQMIDEYVQGVANQIGDDSEDEIEAKGGKIPSKKVHQEESSIPQAQVNGNGTQASASTNGKTNDKAAKSTNSKAPSSNLIKINLAEANGLVPATPVTKSRPPKKDKTDKPNVIVIEQSSPPLSPKQQKKKSSKKNNSKGDSKKQAENSKDNHANNGTVMIDNPREVSSSSIKTIDPHHHNQLLNHIPLHLQQGNYPKVDEDMAANFAMLLPNNVLNNAVIPDIFKQFNIDQMNSLFQAPGIANTAGMMPKEDLYNFTKIFNGVNFSQSDLEKLYLGVMPHFNNPK